MRYGDVEDQRRHHELRQRAKHMSESEFVFLESRLTEEPNNLELRTLDFFWHFNEVLEEEDLKGSDRYFKSVKWLIENHPSMEEPPFTMLSLSGSHFSDEQLIILQEIWLAHLAKNPADEQIVGGAACLIAHRDINVALPLFQKAFELNPYDDWISRFVLACSNLKHKTEDIAEQTHLADLMFKYGPAAFKTESGVMSHFACDCVANAALESGRFEILKQCIEAMMQMNEPFQRIIASAYSGLLNIREGNLKGACKNALKYKLSLHHYPIRTRLMKELFDLGKKKVIVELVRGRRNKNPKRKAERERWLKQLENGQFPDFENCCDAEEQE